MRIVGGEFRGRLLATPNDNAIRPTTDRVRESLFSILTSRYYDNLHRASILDLFAGTGALGLEALSRGAGTCVFVENSLQGQKLIAENIAAMKLAERTKLLRTDATKTAGPLNLMKSMELKPFDLIFADPPYNKGLAQRAIHSLQKSELLKSDTLIVLEESASAIDPQLPECALLDTRKFGDTKILFYKVN